jgi:hypothetical protein
MAVSSEATLCEIMLFQMTYDLLKKKKEAVSEGGLVTVITQEPSLPSSQATWMTNMVPYDRTQ